jgi:predicted RNA-binding protein with PUA-like domain
MTEPDTPAHQDKTPRTADQQLYDSRATTGTPRWVKVFLVVAIALVALFVVVHLAGGGMGNHLP